MRPSTSLVLVATVLSGLTGVYGAAIPAYEPNTSIIHEPLHAKHGENYVRSDLTQTEADLEREGILPLTLNPDPISNEADRMANRIRSRSSRSPS